MDNGIKETKIVVRKFHEQDGQPPQSVTKEFHGGSANYGIGIKAPVINYLPVSLMDLAGKKFCEFWEHIAKGGAEKIGIMCVWATSIAPARREETALVKRSESLDL